MFAIRMKELREAAGYRSQQAFADDFGVGQSTVGNWEAGKRIPDLTTLIRLADFFKISVDELVGHGTAFANSTYMKALRRYCSIAEEAYGEDRYPAIVKFYDEHPEYVSPRLNGLSMKPPERQALRDILGLDVSIAIALGCSLCEKAEDYADFYESSEDTLTKIGQNVIVGHFTKEDRDLLHAYHSSSPEVRGILDGIARQCIQPKAAAARGNINLTKEDPSTFTFLDSENPSLVP